MAVDSVLLRLKDVQDEAYAEKQKAWRILDRNRNRYRLSCNDLDLHSLLLQCAYESEKLAKEELWLVRAASAFRLSELRQALSGDEKSARERRLIARQIQRARTRYCQAREHLETAVADHERLMQRALSLRAHCAQQRQKFSQAEAAQKKATNAFRARLDEYLAKVQERHDYWRSFAQLAGVPTEYHHRLWVTIEESSVNIYFGGLDRPQGEGHGHYVIDELGRLIYSREPFEAHGKHNFFNHENSEDDQRDVVAHSRKEPSSGAMADMREQYATLLPAV
jgi:hypothetical protein